MLNKVKVRFLISLASLAVVSFLVIIGYSLAQQLSAKQTESEIRAEADKIVKKNEEENKRSILTEETVKEFLTQYYTKQKLGENNQRIQPYMTDSAYSDEVASQEEAIHQIYKDYILDYRFDQAKIYIDVTNQTAIAQFSYSVIYVGDLEKRE